MSAEKNGTLVFSEAQKNAIYTSGKTLLISAGAGSGKTTVLTERIIEKIKSGTDIGDILVVTFTKAAASTLKQRLYSALLKASAVNPSDRRLIRMLYRVPSAAISTIHSFCLNLIRTNFALLALPPSMRVADEAESAVLLGNCFEELVDDKFENDEGFPLLCDAFAGEKTLDGLRDTVISVYLKYRSFPFWRDYVRSACEKEKLQATIAAEKGIDAADVTVAVVLEVAGKVSDFRTAANMFYNTLTADTNVKPSHMKTLDYIADYLCTLEAVCREKNVSYAKVREALFAYAPPTIYVRGLAEETAIEYKSIRNGISAGIRAFASYFQSDSEQAALDYKAEAELTERLNGFIFDLDAAYAAAKKKRGILDYSDLEQFTLELLGAPSDEGITRTALCVELQKSFSEIYIDEYQDINPLQDMIFNLISRPDNRFMVGDVKQSIYRFRNASADIFLGYLDKLPPLSADGDGAKIFLSENHRSKKPILDFVNLIFDKLYTVENIGASYENERLLLPENDSGEGYPVVVGVFPAKTDDNYPDDGSVGKVGEAAYVADTVFNLVNRPADGEKAYSYGDIALILRSVSTNGEEYERAFKARGIPYAVEKSGAFLLEPEVLLALSVLRALDNPLDDVSVLGALRSPVFRFNADDIYAVNRFFARDSLFSCVCACAADRERKLSPKKYKPVGGSDFRTIRCKRRNGGIRGASKGERPSPSTGEKCATFLSAYYELRRSAAESPSSRIIWKMYMRTGMISLCAAESNGKARKRNLYTLYRFALDFEKTSFKGLSSFLDYISEIVDSYGGEIRAEGGDENRVRIMSVHKSKGMEFPVCFVSSLGHSFNTSDTTARYIVRDDGFTACNLRTDECLSEYVPLLKIAAARSEKKALLREELRCLYVALTRARERLFVTGIRKNGSEYGDASKGFFDATCPMDWLCSAAGTVNALCFTLNVAPSVNGTEKADESEALPEATVSEAVFRDALEFRYPFGEAYRVPAKAAVSELRKGMLEDDEYTRTLAGGEATLKPSFAGGSRDAASAGTATHTFMQFADFSVVLEKGAGAEAERLVETHMISREDAELIDLNAIERFFRSELRKQISASPAVYREKRFNLIESSALIASSAEACDTESVMIQGVIDCFFINPDGTYTVVDYKTDRVPRENGDDILKARHSAQIGYYRRAVEKMTGGRVSRTVLYSFGLGREVEVPYEDEG